MTVREVIDSIKDNVCKCTASRKCNFVAIFIDAIRI